MRRISQFVMALAFIGTGATLSAAPARAQSSAEILQFCLQNPRNNTCQQIERSGGRVVAQPRRDDRRRDEVRRDDRRGYESRRDDRRSYDRRDDRRRYDRDDRYDRRDDRRWDDDGWDN